MIETCEVCGREIRYTDGAVDHDDNCRKSAVSRYKKAEEERDSIRDKYASLLNDLPRLTALAVENAIKQRMFTHPSGSSLIVNDSTGRDDDVITISLEEHQTTDRMRRERKAGRRVIVKDETGKVVIIAGSKPGRRPICLCEDYSW